jgi:cell division protein FtsW
MSAFNSKGSARQHKPDYLIFVLPAILLAIGLVVVYAISPGLGAQNDVGDNYYVSKQLVAILIGVAVFFIAAKLPPSIWHTRLKSVLIVLALIAAAATQLIGEEINGASRWVQIAGFSFQAVEIAKLALIVWLADFLAQRRRMGKLQDMRTTLRPLLIVFGVISFVVVFLQSDLGSAGVIVAIMGAMAFVAGLSMRWAIILTAIVVALTSFAIVTSEYRRDRLTTFLNPQSDCQGAGYQACQALIAIGSGGLVGKGIDRSIQAYGYLPEAANDSIFAIMAEMFGFMGITIIMIIFMALFGRVLRVIERAPTIESRLMVTGILAWLSTQALINIGAMVGLLPLKGITLPFISYGGTSLMFVMLALGIVFSVSKTTSYVVAIKDEEEETAKDENTSFGRGNRRPYYAASHHRT